MSAEFLVLQGWGGSPKPHWQAWLVDALRAAGKEVSFPDFPNMQTPLASEWLDSLHDAMRELSHRGTVVCHSLAVPLWLHYISRYPATRVGRVLLVAPPGWEQFAACEKEVRGFMPVPLNRGQVAAVAPVTRLVCTNADPACVERAALLYGEPLGVPVDLLPDVAKHINVAAGFGPWPQVLAWCLGRRDRVTGQE